MLTINKISNSHQSKLYKADTMASRQASEIIPVICYSRKTRHFGLSTRLG